MLSRRIAVAWMARFGTALLLPWVPRTLHAGTGGIESSADDLQRFVGRWAIARGAWDVTSVADGAAIYSVFTTTDGYTAHGLWGYDGALKCIRSFEVNSRAQVMEHRGNFVSADVLELVRTNPADGAMLQRSTLTFRGADHLDFEAEYPGRPTRLRYEFSRVLT